VQTESACDPIQLLEVRDDIDQDGVFVGQVRAQIIDPRT
jgi:hypothetical protein